MMVKTSKGTTNMGIILAILVVGILLYTMILLKEWIDNE